MRFNLCGVGRGVIILTILDKTTSAGIVTSYLHIGAEIRGKYSVEIDGRKVKLPLKCCFVVSVLNCTLISVHYHEQIDGIQVAE
jgi:hypothetical protein